MTPSLVVLIARKGVIVLHEAFGKLAPEPNSLLLPRDAIFPIASISKLFTATAAMILVDDGLLGLNRPVQEYVPEFEGEGKQEVMVHHLLNHTSGLRDDDVNAYLEQKLASGQITAPPDVDDRRLDRRRLVQYFSQAYDAPLGFRLSAEMSYCNHGYLLLGKIVERVSDRRLATFVQDRILAPLGLSDTAYGVADSARARYVRRNPDSPAGFLDDPDLIRHLGAAGGICSTAYDLATFGQLFLNRGHYGGSRILSAAAVAEMTRNQTAGIAATHEGQYWPESSWGFGWDVHNQKRALREPSLYSPRAISHSGMGSTHLVVDPDYDLVTVYLSVHLGALPSTATPLRRADLFVDAAIAAIDAI
jgi:CubicO group peptidase (beta-lactamase class C family)